MMENTKLRKCLKCREDFESVGIENRLCKSCKSHSGWQNKGKFVYGNLCETGRKMPVESGSTPHRTTLRGTI